MRRSPSLIAIAIPTVLTAAAVYIALFFATRITGTLLKTDQEVVGSPEVRPVATSEMPPPWVEQVPPPSPELVAERVRQELEADRQAAHDLLFPRLEIDAEPGPPRVERLSLEPLSLPRPALPNGAGLLRHGTPPPSAAEKQ